MSGENVDLTAIHTKVEWVLSGAAKHLEVSMNFIVDSTHTLKFDICPTMDSTLDDRFNYFILDLKSLGIAK